MNNIFSFYRFGQLFKKEMKEFYSKYGISSILILSVLVVIWVFILVFTRKLVSPDQRQEVIFLLFSIFTIMLPFKLYGDINDKKKGVFYTLLPASILEKYSVMVISCIIIYPTLFLIALLSLDGFLSLISGTRGFSDNFFSSDFLNIDNLLIYIDSLFIGTASILGNLMFIKHKFSKTFLSLIVFGVVLTILTLSSMSLFIEDSFLYLTNADQFLGDPTYTEVMEKVKRCIEVCENIFPILISVLFLTLSYFRLKKLQY